MENKRFEALEENAGMRIDKFLSECGTGLTRSAAAKLIEDGAVTVGDSAPGKNYRIRVGDIITLQLPDPVLPEAKPENIPLDIEIGRASCRERV